MTDGSVTGAPDVIACVGRPSSLAEFDEDDYLAINPDVRHAGMPAAEHFRQFGQREGRMQLLNKAKVAEMRERKLARVRFRSPPTVPRVFGEPANFMSAETIAAFAIPESPPISSNDYSYENIGGIESHPGMLYLDIGAGLRRTVQENVINTEIYPSVSTDVICVGEDLPFEGAQFDVVLCMAVLEHTRRPWDVAREICRVLKPGGTVLVDYPFLQGVHGYPNHYFNATPQGAISLFEDLCDIRSSTINSNNHPMQSIWWILASWRSGLTGADRTSFEQLRIGDILARPPENHMEEGYCAKLDAAVQRIIPAGSTLVAVRKAAHAEVEMPIHDRSWDFDRSAAAMSGEAAEPATESQALRQPLAILRGRLGVRRLASALPMPVKMWLRSLRNRNLHL